MAKELFQCDVCNRIHVSLPIATECENSHQKVLEIRSYTWEQADNFGKYPKKLTCKMTDGKTMTYTRS